MDHSTGIYQEQQIQEPHVYRARAPKVTTVTTPWAVATTTITMTIARCVPT
jgi:hypothetical protein